MSKKKKITTIVFALIFVAIGVFVLITVLNPKPDMKAPYENFYAVVNNENLEIVEKNNDNLINYMSEFAETGLISTSTPYMTKYTVMQKMFDNYTKLDEYIQNNILYLTDYDNDLVDIQRKLTEKHEVVIAKYDACVSHIKTHIVPLRQANNTTSWTMMNAITAYDTLFMDFVCDYAEFYSITTELFANYTTTTIDANPYTRVNLRSVAKWSQKIVENLKEGKFDGVTTAVANLEKFTSSVIVSNPSMYYNSFEYFNSLIAKINSMPDELYTALANDTVETYYASITDTQVQADTQQVLEEYFEITLSVTPLNPSKPVAGGMLVWKEQ